MLSTAGIDPASATAAGARASNPLSAEDLEALAVAQGRAKRIRRAVKVALFDAWTTIVIAAPAVLFGLFDRTSLIVGIALSVVAYNEFTGARELKELNMRAPRRLALNQLGLCVVIIVYALWSMYTIKSTFSSHLAPATTNPQVADMLGSIKQIEQLVAYGVYGSLIVFSVLIQGGTAWFYSTRTKHLREYVAQTPEWILKVQRIAG